MGLAIADCGLRIPEFDSEDDPQFQIPQSAIRNPQLRLYG